MTVDAEALVLLREIAADVRAIRGVVERERPRRPEPGVAMLDLLRAIHAAMGVDFLFTSADLAEAAELARFAALHAALLAAIGSTSPRRIGKALRAIAGRDLDGLRIEKMDDIRDGAQWALRKCGS